mmetsp:Transcript_25596/g.62250  ORF Transcript_25596/g.62250 Transcript_25596/m.62250 type:complete len:98 (+) Transcript_25596:153-446(+)
MTRTVTCAPGLMRQTCRAPGPGRSHTNKELDGAQQTIEEETTKIIAKFGQELETKDTEVGRESSLRTEIEAKVASSARITDDNELRSKIAVLEGQLV